MKFRTLGLAIAAASALSPSLSQAWAGKTSLNACVSAFKKSLDPSTSHDFKVVFSGNRFSDVSSYALLAPVSYTYDLAVNDVGTGKTYARARCLADANGTVSLSPLPLDAGTTRTASLPQNLR